MGTTPPFSQDRLVRKEVALGTIRQYNFPQNHIGLSLCPFQTVQSDDVIFSYIRDQVDGLAPARAEDAESELATKDDSVGSGRASLIDWAIKDHYDVSDVTRWRQGLLVGQLASDASLSLLSSSMTEDFSNMLARDELLRRRKLDNRIEWLIMKAIDTGAITYNDGKIVFSVSYQRPSDQQDMACPSGHYWTDHTNGDPIGDIIAIQQDAEDNGVEIGRVIMSKYAWRNMYQNARFQTQMTGTNPIYTIRGWSDDEARKFISDQTGVEIQLYDSVYRTRAAASNTVVNTRFTRQNMAIFLPSDSSIAEYDDAIGFGKTLTSPHPEGNWESGFYEWEKDTGPDPWGYDRGTGIKAFPVLPHLDKTYVMQISA